MTSYGKRKLFRQGKGRRDKMEKIKQWIIEESRLDAKKGRKLVNDWKGKWLKIESSI